MEIDFERFYNRLKEVDATSRQSIIRQEFSNYKGPDFAKLFESITQKKTSKPRKSKKIEIISDLCDLLPDNISALCKEDICKQLDRAFDMGFWARRINLLDRFLQWTPDDHESLFDFPISLIGSNNSLDDKAEFDSLITKYYRIAESNVDLLIQNFIKRKEKNRRNKKIIDFIEKIESKLQIKDLEKINGPQLRQIYFQQLVATMHILDHILLLGPSGVGKSTLCDVICVNSSKFNRFLRKYSCDQGEKEWNRLLKDLEKDDFEGGTVFLDEVHKLEDKIQERLVTIFEQRGIRIISASSQPLERLDRDMFIDFFTRYKQYEVEIKPLWRRKEDLKDFILTCAKKRNRIEIDKRMVDVLVNHKWPGNYREIENFFAAICPIIINDRHECLKVDLLRKYKDKFSPSVREIMNKVM